MKLYAHPFSSYCQKVLIALYENDTSFEYRLLALDDARIAAEHLGLRDPGPVRLIPADARVALGVPMMDRFFDHYVSTPMKKIVPDSIRAAGHSDAHGVGEARELLDSAYRCSTAQWKGASGWRATASASRTALRGDRASRRSSRPASTQLARRLPRE